MLGSKAQHTLGVLPIDEFPAITLIDRDSVERGRRIHHDAQSIVVDPHQLCFFNPGKACKSNMLALQTNNLVYNPVEYYRERARTIPCWTPKFVRYVRYRQCFILSMIKFNDGRLDRS